MNNSAIVRRKIKMYSPKGGLDHAAKIILSLAGINHKKVKEHKQNLAILAEKVAKALKKDCNATFFAALLHDIGKLTEPDTLFDGHNISAEEYAQVKRHVEEGFEALKEHHLFTALCAGYHHAMFHGGYGLTTKDLPCNWHMGTIKKVLEISAIISICDFIEAFTHRETIIKDGSDSETPDLKGMLYKKYPDDHLAIDIALKEAKKLGWIKPKQNKKQSPKNQTQGGVP
jgi:putative nucleotidyltransferase with HDIG domain